MNKIAQLSHSRDRRHEYDKEHVRELDFVAHYKDDRWSQSLRLGKPSPTLGVSSFELIKTLGTGTFARVWLARLRDGSSGRKETNGGGQKKDRVFALKILRKVDIIKLKQVEHVRNERCTLGAVSGFPFITTLITTFVDNESLYMLVSAPLPPSFYKGPRTAARRGCAFDPAWSYHSYTYRVTDLLPCKA